MAARTARLLPDRTTFYEETVAFLLPAALILLLLSAKFSSLFKIGRISLLTMLVGSFGIVLGGPFTLFLFQRLLPEKAWMGFGTLAGSWIGGSINMAALKEALGTPHELFSPMVFVDSVMAYSWMAFLLYLSPYQEAFDRWNHSKKDLLEETHETLKKLSPKKENGSSLNLKNLPILLAVASGGTGVTLFLSKRLPSFEGAVTEKMWLVLLATTLAIALSWTPLSRLEERGATRLGTFLLYVLLVAMGAQADLKELTHLPLFVLVGAVWVFIHGLILFVFGKIFRIPLFFLVTASQANIGGVVSAPIVAACYKSHLAPLGLLLALFGNGIGTYLGLLTASFMRLVL